MSAAKLRECGWVWEGLGFDPGLLPSVYGVGEGATYFDLEGANFLFHENNEINLAKLSHVPRVTADISKWVWRPVKTEAGRFTFAQHREDSPEYVATEAEKVSRLSLDFPNLVAGFIDDTHGVCVHNTYTSDTPGHIKEALHKHNPDLDLWIVVYTHEFDRDYWPDWLAHVDVINLWVWKSEDLVNTDEYIAQWRELFPDKRLVMGVYLTDYALQAPVPLDMLAAEMEAIERHVEAGTLDGYNILGACLIDQRPEQAEFVREFIHQ